MLPQTVPKTLRRSRFQFSLRALMVAVLLYGALWLLTIKCGGAALARSYAAAYPDELVKFTESDAAVIEVLPKSKVGYYLFASPSALRGTVRVPFPFVLIWMWEARPDMGIIGSEQSPPKVWQPMNDTKSFHVWIPWCRFTLPNELPQFQKQGW